VAVAVLPSAAAGVLPSAPAEALLSAFPAPGASSPLRSGAAALEQDRTNPCGRRQRCRPRLQM